MTMFRVALAMALMAGLAACAPQSAYQAVGELGETSGMAGYAAGQAGNEASAMGGLVNEVKMDVRNVKEVERWFDQKRKVSFD